MLCTKCGYAISSTDRVCPKCATTVVAMQPDAFPWTRLLLIVAVGLVLISVAFQVSRSAGDIAEEDFDTRNDRIERALEEDESTMADLDE